jgi:prepilin-type N-terminal cleavage/methylation domain-containing protein
MKIHDKASGEWRVAGGVRVGDDVRSLWRSSNLSLVTSAPTGRRPRPSSPVTRHSSPVTCRGFTMVEIAISLAIIGIALVSIIGVLPIGMNTQRDNREETLINQDATVLLEAIRSGAHGLDDLTNYVYALTNYWGQYNSSGVLLSSGVIGCNYTNAICNPPSPVPPFPIIPIHNGSNIVGLLSAPEYTDNNGLPIPTLMNGGYSNHIVAYVRSISGPAVEKPPQDNPIIQQDSFGYRVLCVNAPVAADTNNLSLLPSQQFYNRQLAANLHELRLTFFWPQLPNGNLGPGRQTFRTMVAGQTMQINNNLYFYQPQSFVNATNVP